MSETKNSADLSEIEKIKLGSEGLRELKERELAAHQAKIAAAAEVKKYTDLTEAEQARLSPEERRNLQFRDAVNEQSAERLSTLRAMEAKRLAGIQPGALPSWIKAKGYEWDHRGTKVEADCANPPHALPDGRVLLSLTSRKFKTSPNLSGNVGAALAKMNASGQSLEPTEQRWLAVGGILDVPEGKSVSVWAIHKPGIGGPGHNDAGIIRGCVLDAPRLYTAGYRGEITVLFHNSPDHIMQLSAGAFVAVAELVDA